MKNYLSKAFLLMFSLCLLSTQCDEDDVLLDDNSEVILNIIETAQSGTWRITNYVDSGQNRTADFAGYDFTFEASGTLTATDGVDTKTGTWSVTDDSSSSSNDDDIDFNIFFSVPDTDDFEDLNDDWDFVSYFNNQIALRDVSGGDGNVDEIVFTKNQ